MLCFCFGIFWKSFLELIRRCLSDTYEAICRLSDAYEASRRLSDAYEASRRLSDAYETRRRLSDAYGHFFKKKIIFVIFGRFKKKNPRAVGFWIEM